MHVPRIVLAGTHSGVGKTTLATGLMATLKRRGRPVQGYKVGPDYIDPSHHAAVTGRPSRNLDRWLLGDSLTPVFTQSAEGQWAVIEGVMGMYDGMSGTAGFGSTADIAKLLTSPVILIVDATGMGRSVAALVYGYAHFDPDVMIAGVILNRVKSLGQENMMREALQEIDLPVVGILPYGQNLKLPERHLGLIPAGEEALRKEYISDLVGLIDSNIDLALIEQIMLQAPEYEPRQVGWVDDNQFSYMVSKPVRIGLAWDEAFLFYYRDALDAAVNYGFDFVPFSPLHDAELPAGLDSLFIGGGFPELHLQTLSANVAMHESIRAFARSGKPVYAECGGYMYLGDSITDFAGQTYPLTGVVPAQAEMTTRLQGLGYRRGIFCQDNFLGPSGTEVHGHEFHYSRVAGQGQAKPAYQLFRGKHHDKQDGYAYGNIMASYLHLHFAGHPELLQHWAEFIHC